MTEDWDDWGAAYRRRRERRSMSRELCAALAGLSLRSVERYERGQTEPTVTDARRLRYALDNPVGALIALLGEWAAEAADRPAAAFINLDDERRDIAEVKALGERLTSLAESLDEGLGSLGG